MLIWFKYLYGFEDLNLKLMFVFFYWGMNDFFVVVYVFEYFMVIII